MKHVLLFVTAPIWIPLALLMYDWRDADHHGDGCKHTPRRS